jgi:bis(5'-nucleosyl)-tetraphosphatase (symmetrical)
MATYAIGDVQGCFEPLQRLFDQIQFNPEHDTAWFTGDIVNRGPQSLETLRFIKQLGKAQRMVLGNHDLHLLAVAMHAHQGWKEDTFQDILTAPDRDDLIHWLQYQPLLHLDESLGYLMIHAGLAPSWDLSTARTLAYEIESALRSEHAVSFLQHMYGNHPAHWDEQLTGWDRLRCITNYLTRARFCHPDGQLELDKKGKNSPHLIPWFNVEHRQPIPVNILFGHWAALGGITNTARVFALDTGCVWGRALTAMRLEDKKIFTLNCSNL